MTRETAAAAGELRQMRIPIEPRLGMIGRGRWLGAMTVGGLAGCLFLAASGCESRTSDEPPTSMTGVIPLPALVESGGESFRLTASAAIRVDPGTTELLSVGEYLAERLRPATGYPFPVAAETGAAPRGSLTLTTSGADPALGDEGYELTITTRSVQLVAAQPAGLFHGIQTLRQLLPATIETAQVQAQDFSLPTGHMRDLPRFAWRGAMLDVARHFFAADVIKRYIDLLAYYKMNRLHLHLTDDQGWRIEIRSWPRLTEIGGSSEIGGGAGGFYTQEEYADIVAYAASRYITIVPEIDMPGHVNAALASYAELNCDDVAPAVYTGTEVGFSSLCFDKEVTLAFVGDVLAEVAALTPGPYLHLGGDEAATVSGAAYYTFMTAVGTQVTGLGKTLIGWEELSKASLPSGAIIQHWRALMPTLAGAEQGAKVIMSPAMRIYLDMKYDASTPIGTSWAGYVDVEKAYDWDPVAWIDSLPEESVLGVEAPLWTELIATRDEVDYMAFPRLIGAAEIGWSPANGRSFAEYVLRLAAHAARLDALGVEFYRSPEVAW